MKFLIVTMLILRHMESGDIEEVVSCEQKGENLTVNYGFDWYAEFPVSEYKCELWEYKGE